MPILFVLVAVLQIIVPVLPRFGSGMSIGERAVLDGIGPELPPGLFFTIWGAIFTSYLITAVWALRAPSAESSLIMRPLIVAGAGNIIWMLSAQYIGMALLDFVLLWPILAASWAAAKTLDTVPSATETQRRNALHQMTVGLLSGWLCVAVSISVPDIGRHVLDRAPSDAVWQSLWMCLLSACALAVLFTRYVSSNLWFYVALYWGLLGVFWNTYFRLELHALGLVTLIVGLLLLRVRFDRLIAARS